MTGGAGVSDLLNSQRGSTLEATDQEATTEDDPARRLYRQDLRLVLDQALLHLSPSLRSTFVMFAELGLSYKEIAETQNVPIGTVMSRIHSAREKLQAQLDWDRLNGLR